MRFIDFEASIVQVHPHRPDALTYALLGLGGETGEVLDAYKKAMRELEVSQVAGSHHRSILLHELGDVLWYAARIAKELDSSLDEVAQMNIAKLAARRVRGGK